MTSKNNVPTDEVVEFELKHRITGAAVLLVFGVLFLPWLLGSPSEANKSDVTDDSTRYQELSAVEIEKELLEAIDNENVDDDIEVYVSRITPLDSASDIRSASDAISSNDAELNNSSSDQSLPTDNPSENKETAPKLVVNQDQSAIKEVSEVIAEERPAPKIEEMIDEESVAVDDLSQTAVAPAQVRSVDKVDVGWVVQVGVFTDKKGAAKVVEDLKLKGFIPSTTIVDTNLGKETGTRVWLGPFAQRVDAAKSITSLKEKTGSDAFIRAYP